MVVEEWLAEDFKLKQIKVQTQPNLQVVPVAGFNKFKSSSLHKQIFIFDPLVAGLESGMNPLLMFGKMSYITQPPINNFWAHPRFDLLYYVII